MPRPGNESHERAQTRAEEIANSVSHGVALLAALCAMPMLVSMARDDGAANLVGASVFGASLVLVYFTSTVYHALPRTLAKHVFRLLDHAAIYLLIAGTYTPFTLGALRGPWGWTLFGLIWGLGLLGIGLKIFAGVRFPRVSLSLYLVMGWLVVIAARQVWLLVPGWGVFWLLAGGLAYTGGVVFYVTDYKPYNHFVWHLFVIAGTACHFIAVLGYSA